LGSKTAACLSSVLEILPVESHDSVVDSGEGRNSLAEEVADELGAELSPGGQVV
jgi:hypothetical protein